MTLAPTLDREAARSDIGLIAAWRTTVERNYGALLARTEPTRPVEAEAIRAFEDACRDDQEWAAGYEAGRTDAERLARAEEAAGPGVSWFGDGFSASITRQAAYDLGLADGRT